MSRLWRSLLFVPAGDDHKLAKAHLRGADAVILDLEDGVAEADKPAARTALPQRIATLAALGVELLVRVNGEQDTISADLEAAVRPGVRAIMLPKVAEAAPIEALAREIALRERKLNMPAGSLGILPLIESPAALQSLPAIADVERVAGLALGTEDFALGLGTEPDPENLDLPCRMIALAAAVRGIAGIGVPVSIARLDEPERFAEGAKRARRMGLTGALCVHPAQVDAANVAFLPSPADQERARRILAAWQRAEGGVARTEDGMIDKPLVIRAEALLRRVT